MRKILILILASFFSMYVPAFAQINATADSDEFVFRFQPPDGTKVRQTYKVQKNRLIEGQPPTKDESQIQTDGIFKRVGDTYEYLPKILSSSMRRNGETINDPILKILSNIHPTYVISLSGEAVAIKGFSEIESLIKSTLPAQLATALAPFLNEATLVSQQKAEWNARYADFADGKFKIGEVIDIEAPQQLPNGEALTYTIRTILKSWEPCPAGRCIRIEQVYESDAAELAKMSNGLSTLVFDAISNIANKSISKSNDTALSVKPSARVTGALSRLIDPKTMLIYSEQLKRSISMQIQIPDKGLVPIIQEEFRTYSYLYE